MYLGNLDAGSRGLLDLSGTRLAVTNFLKIGNTGVVTNHVTGVAGGLDLTFADTNSFLVSASGGRIRLSFEANPSDLRVNYWGLRMAGDQRAYFQALTNDSRLT